MDFKRFRPLSVLVFCLIIAECFLSQAVLAAEVTLAWDRNPEPQVTEYWVFYGLSSRYDPSSDVYPLSVNAKNETQCTISNLEPGKTYYFAAKAFDAAGNSSEYSAELVVTIPDKPSTPVQSPPTNSPPVAFDDSMATLEDTAKSGNLKATDADKDPLIFCIVANPSKGTVSVTDPSRGAYVYTPNTDATGTDSFTFKATDARSADSNVARVLVNITPVNDAPTAQNDSLATLQGTAKEATLRATDVEGDRLKYSLVSNGVLGKVTITDASTGSYKYVPNPNATGTDTFTFKANDGKADSNIATVTVTINPIVEIRLEAEKGLLALPMQSTTDAKASGGSYISVPNGYGDVLDPRQEGAGYAEYTFTVPLAGEYVLYARVQSGSSADNSFFISYDSGDFIQWDTALGGTGAWIWDMASQRSGAKPVVLHLEAGEHTLTLKQREDGTRLDQILITNQLNYFREAIYEDAEDGVINGLYVDDAHPAGTEVPVVFDDARQSNVLDLEKSLESKGYFLLFDTFRAWTQTDQKLLRWSGKFSGDFIIQVGVTTAAGRRYLQYSPGSFGSFKLSGFVFFGLGETASGGGWQTFVRDLQSDLTAIEPGGVIIRLDQIMIYGDGRVDDFQLR
ncbi:Ig-like domain-containing protein [Desulforhabdus sp. TSK]|uniref:Ig-like domain-containing protein n=1 Tax=Desulforhabdus sp. TSK TaxID=2925014 RepID=UPI001FC8B1FC|nr:Ig-like domain-containing protein [Desulforhabdus sp. TSK]GKT07881.1 hypothetical protein DSTSK_11860 [Desulforhabdus sp. TSK]